MHRIVVGLPAAALALGLALVHGLVATASPIQAQTSRAAADTVDTSLDSVAARVDSILRTDEPEAALDLLDPILADIGPHAELSWRAARAAVNRGMLLEPRSEDEARNVYRRAESYAQERIDADSTDARAWEWLAVARGRRSLTEGMRTRATLVNGIRAASEHALRLDSARAGAHHVLGMWNAEIRRLNTFERLGAGALGADGFGEASWDDAVHHLETATRLAPEGLVHGLELARIYVDLDRTDDAITELRRILSLDVREAGDGIVRAEAEALLEDLGAPELEPVSDSEGASLRR